MCYLEPSILFVAVGLKTLWWIEVASDQSWCLVFFSITISCWWKWDTAVRESVYFVLNCVEKFLILWKGVQLWYIDVICNWLIWNWHEKQGNSMTILSFIRNCFCVIGLFFFQKYMNLDKKKYHELSLQINLSIYIENNYLRMITTEV